MEEFKFEFANGVIITIVLGEDGYTVNVYDVESLMGTFTEFEGMLYAIAPVVQDNVSCKQEFVKFAQELSLSLSNTLVIDEIEEILLK